MAVSIWLLFPLLLAVSGNPSSSTGRQTPYPRLPNHIRVTLHVEDHTGYSYEPFSGVTNSTFRFDERGNVEVEVQPHLVEYSSPQECSNDSCLRVFSSVHVEGAPGHVVFDQLLGADEERCAFHVSDARSLAGRLGELQSLFVHVAPTGRAELVPLEGLSLSPSSGGTDLLWESTADTQLPLAGGLAGMGVGTYNWSTAEGCLVWCADVANSSWSRMTAMDYEGCQAVQVWTSALGEVHHILQVGCMWGPYLQTFLTRGLRVEALAPPAAPIGARIPAAWGTACRDADKHLLIDGGTHATLYVTPDCCAAANLTLSRPPNAALSPEVRARVVDCTPGSGGGWCSGAPCVAHTAVAVFRGGDWDVPHRLVFTFLREGQHRFCVELEGGGYDGAARRSLDVVACRGGAGGSCREGAPACGARAGGADRAACSLEGGEASVAPGFPKSSPASWVGGAVLGLSDQSGIGADTRDPAEDGTPTAAPTEARVGVPDESPAVPDESPAVPDESPAVPDESPAVPDESPAVPDESPAVPDESPAVPDESPAGDEAADTSPPPRAPGAAEEEPWAREQGGDLGGARPRASPGAAWPLSIAIAIACMPLRQSWEL